MFGQQLAVPVLDMGGERGMRVCINLVPDGTGVGSHSRIMGLVFGIAHIGWIVIVEMAADDVKLRPQVDPFLGPVSVICNHGLYSSGSDFAHGRTHILLSSEKKRCLIEW